MKIVISLLSLLASAFPLDGQITATLNHLPDGSDEVRIRNNSALSLVAFAVTVNQAPRDADGGKGPFVRYSDPLIDPAAKPLPVGEERVVMSMFFHNPSGKRIRGFEEPVAGAGILADGGTIGDAALLNRLMSRRSNMLWAVDTALEMVSDAGRRNVPQDRLVEQFQKMANSLRHWYLPPEQQIGARVYQSIAGKLKNLPAGEIGSPFPPAAFVEEETAMLRQQRVTLLHSEPSLADATLIER